jgi:hypothetical protein
MRTLLRNPFPAPIAAIVFLVRLCLHDGDAGIGLAGGALAGAFCSAIAAAIVELFLPRLAFLFGLARKKQAPAEMGGAIVAPALTLEAAISALIGLGLLDGFARIVLAILPAVLSVGVRRALQQGADACRHGEAGQRKAKTPRK